MATFPKHKTAELPTSNASAFITAGSLRGATLRKATVINTDTSDHTFDLWLAPDGGSAADANKIDTKTIAGNGGKHFPNVAGHVIPQGGKLYATSDGANTLTMHLSWSEETLEEDAEVS